MTAADYVGIAGLITSSGAVTVSIIVAIRQTQTIAKVDDVHAAVTTENGSTLGQIASAQETRAIARGEPPAATMPGL